MRNQSSYWQDYRMALEDSIQLSIMSLTEYGQRYKHWAVAYSGGKDSTATVAFLYYVISSGLVKAPKSITVLYADTRQELPPLVTTAMNMLGVLEKLDGWDAQVVLPEMDKRFYVYMFGRGVPAPKNRFRWCTPMIKVQPMMEALKKLREQSGEKLLMLTGVRIGESAARDQRIALSCSKDSGECGQGWFQVATSEAIADTLAPLLHWRLCHIYDWLYFDDRHGLDVSGVAEIYGENDVRTGCIGCNLVEEDRAIEKLIKLPKWEHLQPLLEIKPIFRELMKSKWRKRKASPEVLKDGKFSKNGQRMGPYTMEARKYGLEKILDIQRRAAVNLINEEEEIRIRELWKMGTWPEKWSADDIDANDVIEKVYAHDNQLIVQPLLIK